MRRKYLVEEPFNALPRNTIASEKLPLTIKSRSSDKSYIIKFTFDNWHYLAKITLR